MTSDNSIGPDQIRRLRGARSRAAFARDLGVTPLTVYRWELPDEAEEARRPRGAVRARLLALHAAPVEPSPAAPLLDGAAVDEMTQVAPALEHIARGEARKAETELLALLARGRLATAAGRALAAVGLAQIQVAVRSNGPGALAALLPALADADAGRLPADIEARVHATAAVVFAWTDGRIFDPGRVQAHAERALASAAEPPPGVRFFALMAAVSAGFTVGDQDMLLRTFAAGSSAFADGESLGTYWQNFAQEGRALHALVSGRPTVAAQRYEEVAARAEAEGYALLQARALGVLAVRRLDDLADPQQTLALARRSLEIARAARLNPGLHSFNAARALGDALLRLGRFDEAAVAVAEGEAAALELGMPAVTLVPAQARLWLLRGRSDELRALAGRLEAFEAVPIRVLARAYGGYVRLLAALADDDGPAALAALAEAERLVADAGWAFLQRDVALVGVEAQLAADRLDDALQAIRRAERLLDRFPSAWCMALLRRYKGVLLSRLGRWPDGRQLLEAALATFTLAGDVPEAVLTRCALAGLAHAHDEPGAAARLGEAEAELERLGVRVPARPARLPATPPAPRRTDAADAIGVDALVVPVHRLSVRGVAPALVQRELTAVLAELFPRRAVRLEEVDATGAVTRLDGAGEAPAEALEWAEFGDGAGRRLRLGVQGPLADSARAALAILAQVTSLALEIASLGGFAAPRAAVPDDEAPELPGFITASPAMRRLRGELARLSTSRSTVIIAGESGAGKELVARAIHDLSARSGRPYVAFNCAAVPHDLFEGQLFGYKKGAFTGAATDQPGVIRAADGGTLFLDEVGELPLELQPKLLRFLENGEVFPLGERRPSRVDVRIVAATNRDLLRLVREGRFREDLYYRLQVIPLRVPPLRERREDVLALARHFVQQYTPPGGAPPVLAPDATAAMLAHPWPGNVRELRNVIERAMAFAPLPPVLTAEHLRLGVV